ncbi:MAG: N-acetylmuramoyl-L-alanine amidase [Dethiobacteria bacterium]|jgi:N-acetylmuramoyl-L-alanine amidase
MKGRFPLYFFMSLILLLLWTGTVQVEAAETIKITVDGQVAQSDVSAYIDANNRTMVPVRFVSETLGFYVSWEKEKKLVRVSQPGTIVELYIDQQTAYVNGEEQRLDTAAVLKGGRTMVPLRFLAETFGLEVFWRKEERTVVIESQPPPQPEFETETETETETKKRRAIVNGNNVNIRSGPGTDYDRLTQVSKGTSLIVLAESGSWLQVELPGGDRGWIAGWLVDFVGTSTGGTKLSGEYTMPADAGRSALVMKPSVNIRSGPGLQHPAISRATLGQRLDILSEEGSWYAVRLPGGGSGWIAGWLVAVRYDGNKVKSDSDGNQTGNLISRWSAGEPLRPGELPFITDLKAEHYGSKVVLEISADSPLNMPSSFQLNNPSRFVFDFSARTGEDDPAPSLEVNHGAVRGVRLGQLDERTVRVVADLQTPATYALDRSSDGKTITIYIDTADPARQVIVIDPGHGTLSEWDSYDPGAIGPSGLREWDVNRRISMLLGNILLNEGYTVIYTNETNTGLSLEERALVGSLSGADLLVSIHANASTNPSMGGTMTFYHQNALAHKSMALAGYIQAELINRLQRENKGIREANFLVLRSCPIPAVLVEVAFISNPKEEMLLADSAFQRRAAEAIALGIKRYLEAR